MDFLRPSKLFNRIGRFGVRWAGFPIVLSESTVNVGGATYRLFELLNEMACVVIAELFRDSRNRQIGGAQEQFRLVDSCV